MSVARYKAPSAKELYEQLVPWYKGMSEEYAASHGLGRPSDKIAELEEMLRKEDVSRRVQG